MTWPFVNPVFGYMTLSRLDSESRRPSTSTWTLVAATYLFLGGRLLRGGTTALRLAALRLLLARPVAGRALGGGDRSLERRHQVGHLLRLFRWRLDHDGLALRLALDHVQDPL